jgi:YVTN family beta-propeller protein
MKCLSLLTSTLALTSHIYAAPPQNAPNQSYKIEETWKLGGDGSWDYLTLDSPNHLLYIARLNRVMVVDTSSGQLAGEIDGLEHAHGVVLNDNGRTGYISDGGAAQVVVFDRSSYKAIATIPTGKNPDSLLIEPISRRLFVFNGASKSATVVDGNTNTVLATIPLPGKPEFSVAGEGGNVFVNIEGSSQILRIDASSLKITGAWPLAPCEGPSGLSMDAVHHRLFSVCDNKKMAVVDSISGKLVATVPIGEGPDAVVYDPVRSMIFSSNGESGNLTVIQQVTPNRYVKIQNLPTKLGARTLAVDSASGKLYTVSANLGQKPAATASVPKPKPAVLPDSFVVLVISH